MISNTHKKLRYFLISVFVCISIQTYSQCRQLLWSDEFDGTEVDLSKWSFQTGNGCPDLCGWGNGELEYYTDGNSNATVADGILTITAKKDNSLGSDFTSAKLISLGKFSQTYGRFEARMRMPLGTGLWPAFWMLSVNNDWPMTGEIDIMEYRGDEATTTHGTLHYGNPWPDNRYDGNSYSHTNGLDKEFHVYAVEWTENDIQWYFDDVLFKTEAKTPSSLDPTNDNPDHLWPWDSDFYIILNFAVGGGFAGNPSVDQIQLTKPTFEIDYVRVYSIGENTEAITNITGPSQIKLGAHATFSVPDIKNASYSWDVENAEISSGDGTNEIEIQCKKTGTVTISLEMNIPATGNCSESTISLSKTVSVYKESCEFLYTDFEDNQVVSIGEGLGTSTIVENPQSDASNSSPYVLQYTRNAAQQYDNMFLENAPLPNGSLLENEEISLEMDVLSPQAGTIVELQIGSSTQWEANWPVGRHTTYRATTTKENQWETLRFSLSEIADPNRTSFENNLDRIIVLFNPDSYTDDTFYFDNIRHIKGNGNPEPPEVYDINVNPHSEPVTLEAIGENLLWYNNEDDELGSSTPPTQSTDEAGIFDYYVSQTINGCESEKAEITVFIPSDVFTEQPLNLKKGLNLIVLWIQTKDNSIKSIFGNNIGSVDYIKTMDEFWKNGQPEYFNTLDSLAVGHSFIINMKEDLSFTIQGKALENPEITLEDYPSGYSLLYNPYFLPESIDNAFGDDVSKIENIKNFDGYWKPNGENNSFDWLYAGSGYFIKMK